MDSGTATSIAALIDALRKIVDSGEVALLAAGAAVGGGLVTGFYQHARDWWGRPILKLDYLAQAGLNKVEASYKHGETSVDDIYIRVRLRNEGRSVARKCIVYLTTIEEIHNPSHRTPTSFAEAMQLGWPQHKFDARDIPTGADFYVDVVRISKHNPGWNFGVERLFASHGNLKGFSGTYRFNLIATADNADPEKFSLDVSYNGDWHQLRAHPAP